VLITGASGGIGLATAEMFAEQGAKLVLHYHTQPERVRALQQRISVERVAVQADLRDERQVEHLFAEALKAFGRIDVVVVNAGIFHKEDVPLHEMSTEQWRQDVAAAIVFLASDRLAGHLSGTILPIAGGMEGRLLHPETLEQR
jgi:NAD(P)-dependent dehydrogenase (short-subunit alcohol dehydrogenase family)